MPMPLSLSGKFMHLIEFREVYMRKCRIWENAVLEKKSGNEFLIGTLVLAKSKHVQ